MTLASGFRLRFPAGATATPVTISYQLWLPEPGLAPLGPHDSLLSGVLELRPHGLVFHQAGQGGWRMSGDAGRLGPNPHTPCLHRT